MENFNVMLDPYRGMMWQTGTFLPRLVFAIGALVVGWLVAKAVRFAVVKGLHALNFNVLTERSGIDGFLKQGGSEKDTTDLFGVLAYAVVWLLALIVAFNALGLIQVTALLSAALLFVPRLVITMVLIVLGGYFAGFIGDAVRNYLKNAHIADADVLGNFVQYGIVIFVVLLSVDYLAIGGGLIQTTFLILLAGIVFALALAFGLGGRDRAADLLERWLPRDGADHRR
ncbi:MAG: hypothetical protein ABI589_06160 [Burkholderiales bacterium]